MRCTNYFSSHKTTQDNILDYGRLHQIPDLKKHDMTLLTFSKTLTQLMLYVGGSNKEVKETQRTYSFYDQRYLTYPFFRYKKCILKQITIDIVFCI